MPAAVPNSWNNAPAVNSWNGPPANQPQQPTAANNWNGSPANQPQQQASGNNWNGPAAANQPTSPAQGAYGGNNNYSNVGNSVRNPFAAGNRRF